jgi:CheY-like chemotaxis protein
MAHNKKVLIIDDSVTNVFLIESILIEYGYIVMTALSAAEAQLRLEKQRPDLILLDLLMPQVSGYEFIRQIKQSPEFSEIPVIIVSAVSDGDSIDEVLKLGAVEYIKKPVVLTVLIDKIESVLTLNQ